ncbi:MAG: SDR family oxidoreductase [Alphaproteobacteria bacterium]|nr:SDR family oxidoreductase [Alphaproteobacteria bacterium]TAD88960.1 MAG: SDR family oxidoreductase [Alphaproteobacteria bacterium]
MGKLTGKVAVVSGGSKGIGGAIVRAFATEGADVAFCHLGDPEGAAATVAAVEALGRRAYAMEVDVASSDACRAFAAAANSALGPVDILVANAGSSSHAPFEHLTEEAFDRVINVHLRGTFFLAQAVYPGMKERGAGRIITITSQLVFKGAVNITHYVAAKAAILGFTRALALEAAPHGVLVNSIAPGATDTDLLRKRPEEWLAAKARALPIGRLATPEDIAPTAVLLASDDGRYFVGACLSPNGGDVMV